MNSEKQGTLRSPRKIGLGSLQKENAGTDFM
jgi:hypothetical protein